MEALYKFNFDCNRMGSLEGIFIAEQENVNILTSNDIEINFGEVLGKYSEIFGTIEPNELEEVTTSPEVISIFKEYDLESGFNPFRYPVSRSTIREYCPEMEDEEVMPEDIIEIIKRGNV